MNGSNFYRFYRGFKHYSRKILTTRGVILLALVATVLLSFISFQSTTKLNDLSGLVNHTHVVQLNLQRTYSALSDADRQLKAFLITQDSTYYFKLMQEEQLIRESLGVLTTLTHDNEPQNKRIFSLDSLIRERWAYMAASIISNEDHYDFFSARIEEFNALLKSSIQMINAEEERLLEARSDDASKYQSSAPRYLLAIQLLIVLFLLSGFFLVTADLKTKERLQRETIQRNKELKEQHDFIQGIFDNTVDVIFIFDQELNILALNKRARALYDPNNSSIGKNILAQFPQARGSQFIQGIHEALKGKHVHNGARESTVHQGIYFESFFVPLYSADTKLLGVMAIHHDVTDVMKMASEVQIINNELKKSNRELEQFAYVASHDLQEPLRKILTFSDLVNRNIENKKLVAKNLEKLSASARRMSTLITDILNYSRNSNSSLEHKEVELNEVLDQVLQDFELKIQEKEAIIEANNLPRVLGSQQQLTQVFSNIISNALKFCTTAPCIKIICKHVDGKYEISFSDNGIGFDPAFADQIFRVFHRLNHRNEYPGTGIGLALCKRIMENHGGSISATSMPEKGTTMTISIPALDQKRIITVDIQHLQKPARYTLQNGRPPMLKNEGLHEQTRDK